MLEMNKVMLIGNLTRDPESRVTGNGKTVASFTLAANRGSGETKTTAYIDCKAWEKRAEFAMAQLIKGKRVYVEGDLRQERWEQADGQKRSKLVVNTYRIDFALPAALEPNAAAEERGGMADREEAPFPDPQAAADPTPPPASQGDMFPDADDLPF